MDGGLKRNRSSQATGAGMITEAMSLVRDESTAITAFQGEIISFKGCGPSKEWR
ncbi:hypothetical protein NXW27_00465 [Phocaeicola dorei]|nr:hypothetical protein [Phocaeicola dorei]